MNSAHSCRKILSLIFESRADTWTTGYTQGSEYNLWVNIAQAECTAELHLVPKLCESRALGSDPASLGERTWGLWEAGPAATWSSHVSTIGFRLPVSYSPWLIWTDHLAHSCLRLEDAFQMVYMLFPLQSLLKSQEHWDDWSLDLVAWSYCWVKDRVKFRRTQSREESGWNDHGWQEGKSIRFSLYFVRKWIPIYSLVFSFIIYIIYVVRWH